MITIIFAVLFLVTTGCSTESDKNIQPDKKSPVVEKERSEEADKIDLYVKVMNAAFKKENGGNSFIAVKLDTLEGLTDESKETVLQKLTSLSANIYDYEEVKNDPDKFEFEGENLIGAINGTVLSIDLEQYDKNKATITGASWFGNVGAVYIEYEAVLKNGNWNLHEVSTAIS